MAPVGAVAAESRRKALAALYLGMNVVTAVSLIMLNKVIMSKLGFHYTYCLTFFHMVATVLGMDMLATVGMYEKKTLPVMSILPLAGSYVGYIVLSNLSLKLNTVSFYTITKIAVAPAVLLLEFVLLGHRVTVRVVASVAVVCIGVGICTVTDTQVGSNVVGMAIALASVASTALYQIWAGSKQKELGASSAQLLREYTPYASLLMCLLVGVFEPLGIADRGPDTVLGYSWTALSAGLVFLSCLLGILVSLSTFLVISVTSSLTYTVIGHIKTIIVLACGVFFFGDDMDPKKFSGIVIAMGGIIWYSQLKTGSLQPAKGSVGVLDEEQAPLLDSQSLPGPDMRPGTSGNLNL